MESSHGAYKIPDNRSAILHRDNHVSIVRNSKLYLFHNVKEYRTWAIAHDEQETKIYNVKDGKYE